MKFKVRLKHYNKDKYCIQYTHYLLIPIWNNLMIYTEGFGWHDLHLPVETAEEIASEIENYQNILNLYQSQKQKEIDYKKKEKEQKILEIPFKIKNIL